MYLPQGAELKNRYVIEGLLGHGGFGITYAAYDQSFGARVAIKEYLPRHLATRGEGKTRVSVYSGEARRHFDYGLKKFMEEAHLLAQFDSHPNVVSARDYFEANGTAYMVMEYAEGVTLKEYLEKKGGRITFEEAKGIMMPVMDALREVHQVGLLHRDISPDNIYITTAAQVRVIDFGAARYFAGEQSKSLSVILKSGYAPEEQYRSSGKQGPWTDVYAVGATLYKLITGQTPPDALDRMAGDTLEPPSRLGVAISPPSERALIRALEVNAGQRFQNMGEFQQALLGGQFMGFQPASAPFQPASEASYPPGAAPVSPLDAAAPDSSQPSSPSPYHPAPRRSANPGAIAAGIVAGVIGLILLVLLITQVILPPILNTVSRVHQETTRREAKERQEQAEKEAAEKARLEKLHNEEQYLAHEKELQRRKELIRQKAVQREAKERQERETKEIAEKERLEEKRRQEAERKEEQRLAEAERQRQAEAKREELRVKDEEKKREAEKAEAEERERQRNLQAEQQRRREEQRQRDEERQRQAQLEEQRRTEEQQQRARKIPSPDPSTSTQKGRAVFYVRSKTLKFRACAGMDCQLIGYLEINEEVEKLGQVEQWAQVRVKRSGQIGWVDSSYLSGAPVAANRASNASNKSAIPAPKEW